MKLPALFLLLVLALLTSAAYSRPLGPSVLVADPTLVFLAWICLVDRWPRILAVLGGLLLYRWSGTIAHPIEVWAPPILMVLVIRIIRLGISPFDRWRRLAIVVPALLSAGLISQWLVASHLSRGWPGFFEDGLLALMVAAVMMPLLDMTRPILKSARYPQ